VEPFPAIVETEVGGPTFFTGKDALCRGAIFLPTIEASSSGYCAIRTSAALA
jgi:hypothetical protein